MLYKSTRCGVNNIGFEDAIMMGLATDGGLIVPEFVPHYDPQSIKNKDFKSIAFEIFKLYISDIEDDDILELIEKSYSTFDDNEITPLRQFGQLYILELFHGPTYAFKDIALQFLGNLFEYVLKKRKSSLNILGATSGDTGSAAIYGLKGKKNVKVFILYPQNGVSLTQELQMCDIDDKNVFPIAVNGTFDDCQYIIKEIFKDTEFKKQYHLGSINSINFARILAQIVYYYYAFLKVEKHIAFSVPTGNFGDIFAGFLAKLMGLPIEKLILATNENDILYRFVRFGEYAKNQVKKTLSPSMDIQVASNFERYLYYLFDQNCNAVKGLMQEFDNNGKLVFNDKILQIHNDFSAHRVSDEEILQTIKEFYEKYNYIIDPHTACGVKAAIDEAVPSVCLATAHPAKFAKAIERALGFSAPMPENLAKLSTKKRKFEEDNNIDAIKHFIKKHAIS